MANPTYKFFQDDLTTDELPRYSNGNFCTLQWNTPELEACVKRIQAELEHRGYKLVKHSGGSGCCFAKPKDCKSAYVGTFLNPYSTHDSIPLYKDKFAICGKYIYIQEVNRHNGTAKNASLIIGVYADSPATKVEYKDDTFTSFNNDGTKNKFTYQTCYINHGVRLFEGEKLGKIRPTVSEKVLKKILDEAEKIISSIETPDLKFLEQDATKFPKSTEIEWKKCKK